MVTPGTSYCAELAMSVSVCSSLDATEEVKTALQSRLTAAFISLANDGEFTSRVWLVWCWSD